MQVTYMITLDGDDELVPFYVRSAALLRAMASALEKDQAAGSGTVGFSVGRNFECIKLTKVDPTDAS